MKSLIFSRNGFVTLVMLVLVLLAGRLGLLDDASYSLYDNIRMLGQPPDSNVLVVAIDEYSLDKIGRYPVPYETHIRLLENLISASVELVAYVGLHSLNMAATGGDDILTSPPVSGQRLADLVTDIRNQGIVVAGIPFVSTSDDDRVQATLPGYLLQNSLPNEQSLELHSARPAYPLPESASGPAASYSSVFVGDDVSKKIRSVPLFAEANGLLIPTLAMQLYLRVNNMRLSDVTFTKEKKLRIAGSTLLTDQNLQVWPYFYPTNTNNRHTVEVISYHDVMHGAVPADRLSGKIVLLGVTAQGIAQAVSTPANNSVPAVMLVADTLASMLDGKIISSPVWAGIISIVLLVLVAILLLWLSGQDLKARVFVTTVLVLILLGIGFILAFAVKWTAGDQKTLVPSVSGSPTQIERAEIIVTQSPTKTAEGEDQPTITPGISQDSTYSEISGELNSAIEGDITLWHAYQSGSTDESVLSALIKNAQDHFPDLSVNVLQIPASEIVRDYQIDVIAGGGPDLFLAPNNGLGNWARDGLVLPLDPYIEGRLEGVSQKAIEAMVVDESIYGIPESTVVVALYYNKSLLESPPRNTEELLQLVQEGKIIANVLSAYYLFGWSGGFGGRLLDDGGNCIADKEGWVEAMQYLVDLKQAGGIFEPNYETAEAFFLLEDAAMFVNGPWSYPKYKQSFGDNLGVVPLPSGPDGPAAPLIGVDGFYINPNSHNVGAALELALYLTNQESSQSFTEFAGHVPVRLDVTSDDPHINAFMESSAFGYPEPQSEQFANYWSPFEEMFFKVLSGEVTPQQGVSEACAKMDAANER